jgi:predicted transcriptional regulator
VDPAVDRQIVLQYYQSYTSAVKTAISLPDKLFKRADRFAKARRISRSELVAKALEAYLTLREKRELTREFNEYSAQFETGLSPTERKRRYRRLLEIEW